MRSPELACIVSSLGAAEACYKKAASAVARLPLRVGRGGAS
jgi:hypothetical protein